MLEQSRGGLPGIFRVADGPGTSCGVRIEIPTLLLYGELDERSPLRVATELEARIPAATLVVIPAVGHISNAEAPEAFNACVREFLRSVDL